MPVEHAPLSNASHRDWEGKIDMKIVEGCATLIAQPACQHPDFFPKLIQALNERGYSITADQLGVRGTYLRLVKRAGPDEFPNKFTK